MDKKQLVRIMISSENNSEDGIPIFLRVDDEDVIFDLKKMHNFIIVGQNTNISINNIVNQFEERLTKEGVIDG